MNQKAKLTRKFAGTAFLKIISRGLALVAGIIYARYLGPEEYGLYSFTLAIITMSTLPVIAGLPNLLIREIANFHLEERWSLLVGVIKWSRGYVILISIIMVACIYLLIALNVFDDSVKSLLFTAVILIPFRGLLTQQGAVLNGFSFPVLAQLPAQIFAPVLTICILCLFILEGSEFKSSSLINISVSATISAFFISVLILRKKIVTKKRVAEYKIKQWHQSLLPFSFIAFVSTLNTELATLLIGWLGNTESVAYFKVAMQAVFVISLGLTSVNTVIMPNVARLYKSGDLNGTQKLLTKSVRLSSIISLPIILLLMFFGDKLIFLLFGEQYLESYFILVILCVGQLVNVLMGSVGVVLSMTGNERAALKSLSIALFFNLTLLCILIPIYGALGAAMSVSISLITWNILMAINVFKLTRLKTWISYNKNIR